MERRPPDLHTRTKDKLSKYELKQPKQSIGLYHDSAHVLTIAIHCSLCLVSLHQFQTCWRDIRLGSVGEFTAGYDPWRVLGHLRVPSTLLCGKCCSQRALLSESGGLGRVFGG